MNKLEFTKLTATDIEDHRRRLELLYQRPTTVVEPHGKYLVSMSIIDASCRFVNTFGG